MKIKRQIEALATLALLSGPALAFDTDIERVGMVYLKVPLSGFSAPKMDKSVMGLRFGQTRISTDSAGSLFTYFRTRPALVDVSFGVAGRNNSAEDIRFGLLDLKLTGISSVEKTYINGQAVVGGVIASKLLIGGAAVAGIGLAAAASNSGEDSNDDSDDDSSGSKDDDKNDDVAENENEHANENEHEEEHEAENEHEEEHETEHEAENEHEEEHEEEHEAENEHEHVDDSPDSESSPS